MTVRILPVQQGAPSQEFQVSLDGQLYTLGLTWNEREGAFYLDVSDQDGSPILLGRKVVVGLPLLARFRDAALPPGQLLAVDTSGQGKDPSLADLGARVPLYYIEASSLP